MRVASTTLPSSLTYEVSVSTQFVDLDLQRTLLRLWLSSRWYRVVDDVLWRWFPLISVLWLATVGCCMTSLFYTDKPLISVCAAVAAACVLVMFLLCCTLSLDVLRLLIRQYEFWFITVFNTLFWTAMYLMLGDIRLVQCFFGWLHIQMALAIDANLRFTREMSLSGWMSTVGVAISVICALSDKLKNRKQLDIVVGGKTLGDLIDVVTMTSSTLIIFLLKILLLKRQTSPPADSSSARIFACVVAKTTLRLCPSSSVEGFNKLRPPPCTGVKDHGTEISQIDAFDTVLPARFWRAQSPSRRRWVVLVLHLCGLVGYGLNLLQNIRDVNFGSKQSGSDVVSTYWYDHVIASGAFVGTVVFCGSSVAFSQRKLLRMLLRTFGFLFSSLQILGLGLCLCDMGYWERSRTLITVSWVIWFLWALSLDALTPLIHHQVLGVSRRVAIPILATLLVSCVVGCYRVALVPSNGLYNRTLWQYILSPTKAITVTTFDIYYGRVVTIVLWCTRQLYRLMTRAPNELYLLHGRVDLVFKSESHRLTQVHPNGGPKI